LTGDFLSVIQDQRAYLVIAGHSTDVIWGFPWDSKIPPIDWMNRWFSQYAPRDAGHTYFCMYQGGELAHNKEVNDLVLVHRYVVSTTGGDTSHQNAPCEHPHQTIGYTLRTMLHGDGLSFKYWSFAFKHSSNNKCHLF
jgi:hypothetical protein